MPLFKDKWDVSDDLVEELRSRFLEEVNSGPEVAKLYHPTDIQRVKENDWFIGRYLLHKERDLEQALRMLKESLKFRNDMEINTLTEEDLPADYFAVRAVILYNKDHRDHPIVVIRAKTHIRKLETRRLQQQYMLYWVEKGTQMSNWGAVTVLFDLTGAGYQNMDMDMMRFILQVFSKYYPWGLGYFLVYNMPWYLSAIWKLVKKWIPEKYVGIIRFVDSKTILPYVSKDQLPEEMGGECTDMYSPRESKVQEREENSIRLTQAY